jgi:maltooligosyltrehalose trehalohydrolase
MDAVWADDFHHQIRRGLAGDREGYYADFSGSTADLATTAQRGWFFCGQHSTHLGGPRGTDSGGIDLWRFVICLQNHDQIGNRALGERLHHQIDAAAYRAATVLLLCLPETPLLFMGQEWAASAPFLYFTDHHADLGRLVTEGRRKEFASFAAFSNPQARESIPDPQAVETFRASQLDWTEPGREPHASVHRLYRELLALRQHYADWITVAGDGFSTTARGADAVRLNYASGGSPLLVVVQLRGNGCVEIGDMALPEAVRTKTSPWNILLHTEETRFTLDPRPVRIVPTATGVVVEFARPGAALFTVRAA